MSIDIGGRRYLAWLGTESGYQPLRADLGTLTGYTVVSRHRRRDTVQITLGSVFEARDQFRAALADRGLDYQTVVELPFEIELVGTGSVSYMFYGCSSLVSVPDLDTSSVTNMAYTFNSCSALTTVPEMDTSSVTNMSYTFQHCSALMSVPDLNTSRVTNMRYMLGRCTSLTDGNVRLIGKHPNVDTTNMIANSGLTREPFYDTNGNPI